MSLLARIPRIPVPAAFRPAEPALAADIGERAITFVRLARSGGRAALLGFHCGEIPDGALRASGLQANVHDPAALVAQVRAAKARVAPSGGPVALSVPDPVARVALLQLDAMPARDAEVSELVSWRLNKQLPYRVDEARVAWKAVGTRGGSTTVLAAAIRRRVLAEYEDLLRGEGFEVGSVTTATLALAESLPAGGGDTLLVHASDGWFSLLWSDGAQPILLRTKQLPASDRDGSARDAAIAGELPPTLEYATQRLGRPGGARILVHDASGRGAQLAEQLERACETPVALLRPTPPASLPDGVADRLGVASSLALRGLGESVTAGAPA